MHKAIVDGLEDYLAGRATAQAVVLQDHLASCPDCRGEVKLAREQSGWLRTLRPAEAAEPAPGFYARVMDRIEAQSANSLWSVFLEPVFAKRLMYSSLALLVLFTSAVWQTGSEPSLREGNPVSIMATFDLPAAPGEDARHDREVVLANLAENSNSSVVLMPVSTN